MRKIFTFPFIISSSLCFGQWSNNPTVNTAICLSGTQQQANRIVTDGNGGAITTWWDFDPATGGYNIFAQRVSAAGNILWAADGVPVCTNPLHQQNPELTSDGAGGTIIVWQDNRSGNCEIYAQRVNANGQVLWTADGVSVGEATNCQTFPQAISDGNGGAYVTWKDLRNGSSYRVYAQRIDANGVNQWGAGGIAVNTGTIDQGEPQLTGDGTGGFIVAWQEYVGGQYDVYAQRVNSNGAIQWGTTGTIVSSAPNFQQRAHIASDGTNGAIIIWEDSRSGPAQIYAQRINGSGISQWTSNGIALGETGLTQSNGRIISDGSGGAFATWRNGNNQIYGQHIVSAGNLLWPASGKLIISASNAADPELASDGGTGTIITWSDYRGPNAPDIYAQRINATGSFLWPAAGINVSTAAGGQISPEIVAGPGGSVIIDWTDDRNGIPDLYGAKINPDGSLASSVILPVAMINFEAEKISQQIRLHWQTASEKNSSYFNVERSNDGSQFNAIGKINSSASSQSLKNYYFTDSSPLKATNYYRLKQVDIDGQFTYSTVVKVLNDVAAVVFSVSPNPAHDYLKINFPTTKEIIDISIYDNLGKLVLRQTHKNQLNIPVEINQLQAGIYFITVSDGVAKKQSKFIRQ